MLANRIFISGRRSLHKLAQINVSGNSWKADHDDPLHHNSSHESKLYSLLEKNIEKTFVVYPFEKEVTRFFKAINNVSIMIRRPALDTIEYLDQINYSSPTKRFLIHGDKGQGKTFTLVHLTHYLHRKQDSLILYLPQPLRVFQYPTDQSESVTRPGRLDLPIDSAYWLQRFKLQNESLLNKLQLKCSLDYTWSLREATKTGDPLVNVIDHGVGRAKHASDCMAVLLKELKLAAISGKVKLSLIVDNLKWFTQDRSELRHTDRKYVMIDEITIARAFKKLLRDDWSGGVVIGTVEECSSKRLSLPFDKLIYGDSKKFFDPFVPIHVPKYNFEEFENIMSYYQSMNWLQRPESRTRQGRDEIKFLSALNPGEIFRMCRSL